MACPKNRVYSSILVMLLVLVASVGIGMPPGFAAPVDQLLTPVATINLPDKGGHGDVVMYDPDKQLIYVAQTPSSNVVVISTQTNQIVTVIPGMKGCNGIAVGPDYLYVAVGDENKVAVIDKTTWKVVELVSSGGNNPDGIYYDAQDSKVFVGNDDSNTMGVLSSQPPFALQTSFALSSQKPVAGPDLGLYVPEKNLIYQSWDNYVLVIDAMTNKIVNRIPTGVPLTEKGGTKSMVYDPNNNTLWVGTSTKQILAMDPDTGKFTEVATASGMDQVSWDPYTRLIFVAQGKAGGCGVVDATNGQYLGTLKTEPDFHTVGVDYDQHLVYAYYNQSNRVVVYKENVDKIGMFR